MFVPKGIAVKVHWLPWFFAGCLMKIQWKKGNASGIQHKAKDLFLGFKWMWLQYLQTNKFCRIVEQYSQECIFYGADKSLYFCWFFSRVLKFRSENSFFSIWCYCFKKMLENLVTISFYSFSIKKSSLIDPCCIFFHKEKLIIPRESIEITTNIKWSQNLNHT